MAPGGLDDIFRKVALRCPEVTDWLCPISGLLMEDPVTAQDHFNFERSAITKWFATVGKVSPQNKDQIEDELETNYEVAQAIEAFKIFVNGTADTLNLTWKHHGSCAGQIRNVTISRDDVLQGQALKGEKVQMCQALSKFFKELDPIEDLLYRMLNGLRPPKIVVVGDESHGKSTILEMLAMLPFFPRKRSCCTCIAIHLRLRRTPGVSRATLTVLSADGQEELCREIPQENGWLIVQEEMTRLQEELFGSDWKGPRIISDKTIVVKVERPDVPCLDLVDLPGMVRLPEEKAEQIHRIYQRQLQDDRDSGNQCMYLAVVEASRQPNATCVMPFIMAEGLQDRTFGIFSKCDKNSDADVLRALTLNENTAEDETPESVGGVHLPNGWVATMQEPPQGQHFNYHNYERMYRQLKQEAEWFQNPNTPERKTHWPRLVEQNSAGIADLVPRVQQMYLNNLQVVWKDYAMLQILEKEAATELGLNLLGVMEDEDKKHLLAQQEVQRRLGPKSQVTKNMYDSFVEKVLHKTMFDKVRDILGDFAVGLPCPGHEFPKLLRQIKEKLLDLMEEVLRKMKTGMVDAVGKILRAESELCKDGPCDFNIRIATLRLYEKGLCKCQWELQERLKEEPIIQLCHFEDYITKIMEKYSDMLGQRELRLRQSLESLINRLVDVDLPSPYLQVTSAFLSQDASETDYTDSRVIIKGKWQDFLNAFLRCCYQHVPHPDELQNLHEDMSVGKETKEARALFDGLTKELDLVRKAKASIIRALSIENEDMRSITDKFEVEQLCKVELMLEDFKMAKVLFTAEPGEVNQHEEKTTEVQTEANALEEESAKIAMYSGSVSCDPSDPSDPSMVSSPTSEGFWHVKAESELSGKEEEASPADSSEAAENEAPKESKASRKQKKGKNRR